MYSEPIRLDGWLPDDLLPTEAVTSLDAVRDRFTADGASEIILPEYTPISNQGRVGSCVANSTADMLEILLGIAREEAKLPIGDIPQLSRLFIYWVARARRMAQKKDEGTYIRLAAQQLMEIGVPLESVWPYDPGKVYVSPPLEAYTMASDNKIKGLFRITSSGGAKIEDIRAALQFRHPVVFGTIVGDDFGAYRGEEKVFGLPTHIKGRHAMIITGYRTRNNGSTDFYVRNSWGEGWGLNGHAWFSQEYIQDFQTQDLWVGTIMQELVL